MSAVNNCTSEEMMEQLQYWLTQLHQHAPDSIGDLLNFSVVSCDIRAQDYFFTVETKQWMQNPFGSLHGGIIATVMDQGMGMLATCLLQGTAYTPSVQLNITYHRPLLPEKRILLKLHVDSMTRTLIHVHGEAYHESEPEKLCVSAYGIFFIKPLEK